MVSIPNIYTYKNLKLFIAIPLVLMVIGILLSTQIVLDTSLRGGVSIIIQTNSTLSSAAIASQISSVLHIQAPEIAASPGGLQITLPINQSLANAEAALVDFYAQKTNYSNALVNATQLGIAYHQNASNNSTVLPQLQQANANVNASLKKMKAALLAEVAALQSFGLQSNTSTNDAAVMQQVAEGAYTNASAKYQVSVIAGLHTIVPFTTYSYQQVTPTLGQFFLSELTNTIIIAFVLIFFVVLLIFRSPIPSALVVFGAANDIIIALGAMGLFKIPLGVASVAGLLMLIGYSIDTDVLTAVRILRRGEGVPEERAYSAMKTGMTMTATAIVSFGVLFAISIIEYVPTYYEISGVVLMGLIGDLFTTWLGNASMILLYKKKKDRI
jgi:preprotein translocase subunit SecF